MMSGSNAPPRGGPTPTVTRRGRAGVDDPESDVFFAAIETTPTPMVLTDPTQADNPIVFANQAFTRMTGYDRAEVVGRNSRFLEGPDTDGEALDEVRRAIRGRHEVATELLAYRKDGTTFWSALSISPIFDRSGTLVYFLASHLDASRRRDAEDALRQTRTMEAGGQLAGGFAHDFNNLLQVITGHMEGLKEHAAASQNPRLIRQVGAVAEAADRARSLTQRLLVASRGPAPTSRIVNLNALVSGLGETMRRVLGDAVQVVTRLDGALWNANLDPSRAETAILDVVVNARDAMPAGGTATIATANLEVGSGGSSAHGPLAPGRYVVVRISDTGVGTPEHVSTRALDPSFTREKGAGTGLGLPMVQRFVERSGGAVRVDGEAGRGTTVHLCFPAADQGDQGMGSAAKPALARGGGERILVVDDRPEVAELARTMLEDFGYAVEIASDGTDALTKLDGRFDLLFSDMVMPGGIDGVSLAREARRRRPELKVLLTTGYADPSLDRADDGEAEFNTIAKPYRRQDLAKKVRFVLDGRTGTGDP